MQVVGSLIAVKLVSLAVNLDVSLADAVRIASRNLSGTGAIKEVVVQILVANHHVGEVAVTVWHFDFKNTGAQRAEFNARTTGINEFIGG